jgi:hypothetical protein
MNYSPNAEIVVGRLPDRAGALVAGTGTAAERHRHGQMAGPAGKRQCSIADRGIPAPRPC